MAQEPRPAGNREAMLAAASNWTVEEGEELARNIDEASEWVNGADKGPGYPPMPLSGPRCLSPTELEAWLKNPDLEGNREALLHSMRGRLSEREADELERYINEANEWPDGKEAAA